MGDPLLRKRRRASGARRVIGRRRYAAAVLTHLTVVRMAQDAGFTVAEIRTLLHGFSDDTSASVRWRALAERKIAEADALIVRAQQMRRVLAESLSCGCLTLDDCAVVGWRETAEAYASEWKSPR